MPVPPPVTADAASTDYEWKALRDIMLGDQVKDLATARERIELLEKQAIHLTERLKLTFSQQSQQMRAEAGPATLQYFENLPNTSPEQRVYAGQASRYLLLSAFEMAAKESPGQLARILTPVLGPTIRTYVKAIFTQLITQMDTLMRQANVFQRMWWRLQALRKGMSYAEYVLLQTAYYSVVHAKLLNRDTSEMVAEAGSDIPAGDESDPFAAQSTLASALGNQLQPEWETLRLSGNSLALQLRTLGSCPPSVRAEAERTLSKAENYLNSVSQPASKQSLDTINTSLEALLRTNQRRNGHAQGVVLLATLLLCTLSWAGWHWWQGKKESMLIEKMAKTPGYSVQGYGRERGFFVIRGLRDPLAPKPESFLEGSGIAPGKVAFQFTPINTLEMAYEKQRMATAKETQAAKTPAEEAGNQRREEDLKNVISRIGQMDTSRRYLVEAMLKDSVLGAKHSLMFDWINDKLRVTGNLPQENMENLKMAVQNIEKVVTVDLAVKPVAIAEGNPVHQLETLDVPFVSGTQQMETGADQAMTKLAAAIAAADKAMPKDSPPTPLRLRSWPIRGVWQDGNRDIQSNRLKLVQDALIKLGIAESRFQPGVLEPTTVHARQGIWVEWLSEKGR